jgi:hypothetical protein
MNPILDDTQKPLIASTLFSKLSFATAIITAILMVYYMSQIPSEVKASDIGKPFIAQEFVLAQLLFCALGVIFTITSFVKKEPSNLIKWMGAIVNFLPVLIFIWSIFLV